MKSHFTTLLITLFVGYIGGVSSLYFHSETPSTENTSRNKNTKSSNPFRAQNTNDDLDYKLELLQLKIETLESKLISIEDNQKNINSTKNTTSPDTNKNNRSNQRVEPSKDNLVSAGINPDMADDILRRISQQDYRRLELQNLMQRSDSSARRQYSKELRELNQNKISLRSELGDDAYDQYLFSSGQNNRVEVSSVMSGSPAESSGFETGDVILYYDDQKILNWPDIRKATIQGEIGSYTSVEIMRDGTRMSLMVPRGTLGVQLDPTQLDPDQ